jgi:phosphoribosylformimino-5-aminoimidazole carboxamide ribotide isomerase
MLLIPAIDLRGGRCVRLYQGDFAAETGYACTPAELLRHYRRLGASWVHIVDLDGARTGAGLNRALILELARSQTLQLQVGGGVRSASDIASLLAAGVGRVVLGSAALEQPLAVRSWLKQFGAQRVCLAFDVREDEAGTPRVLTRGWRQASGLTLDEALGLYPVGVRHVLCTDSTRDGALSGPNVALYQQARRRFPRLAWQASGGVRGVADLAALADAGVTAAISGRALLEKRIPVKELRPFLPDASSPASTSVTARS